MPGSATDAALDHLDRGRGATHGVEHVGRGGQLGDLVVGQLEVGGGDVGFELGDAARAGDRDDVVVAERPTPARPVRASRRGSCRRRAPLR